jgi:hypothetical protein
MAEVRDQKHPLYADDRSLVDQLLSIDQPSDHNLADLARLQMRYQDFIGARDIQADLVQILQKWRLDWETLFTKTRQIHANSRIYATYADTNKDDWA